MKADPNISKDCETKREKAFWMICAAIATSTSEGWIDDDATGEIARRAMKLVDAGFSELNKEQS